MERKYKRLLSNTAIIGLGTIASKLIVFLLVPLYTACLTPAEYSAADIITQSANLLMPIMALGICETVFRYTLDKNLNRKCVLTTGFAIILFGALVILILFPLLNSIEYFDGNMWLIVLYTFAANIHSLFAQYVRARGMTSLFAVQGIIGTAIVVLLNILFLVLFKMSVIGYVLSTIISDIVVSLLLFWLVRLDYAIRPKYFSYPLMRDMLAYSLPLIPTTIFWWIVNVSARFMIVGMIGNDVNGLYDVAFKIPSILILLSGMFIEAWQFSAVTERDNVSKRAHAAFFSNVFDSFQGLMFISAAGLIAFSKVISKIMFNVAYYAAWRYMPLLIMATVASSLVTFMGSVYLVDKKSVQSFITSAVGAGSNIVLNLIMIPTLGANGAALATLLSYLIVFVIRAVNTRRYIWFDIHENKLIANTVVLGIQTVFMIFELQGWLVIQIIGVFMIMVMNFMPILRGAMKVLRR